MFVHYNIYINLQSLQMNVCQPIVVVAADDCTHTYNIVLN